MKRIAVAALLVLAATGVATTTPKARTIASLCKQAAADTPAGTRARAMRVNEAARQADAVAAALKHADDEVRVSAAWALRHGSGPDVAEALVRCLARPDGGAR